MIRPVIVTQLPVRPFVRLISFSMEFNDMPSVVPLIFSTAKRNTLYWSATSSRSSRSRSMVTLLDDTLATSFREFDASFSRREKSLETDFDRRENACVALGLNLLISGVNCNLRELRKYWE